MKKNLLSIFSVLVACVCLSAALPACEGEHTHSYTMQVPNENYLKRAATCMEKAVYYCSCECGAKGTTFFEYGEPDPEAHTFDRQIISDTYKRSAATCMHAYTYYYSCECGAIGTAFFEYGDPNPNAHTFDRQVIEDRYLKSAATSSAEAEYYYSCECGEAGTESFKNGDKLPHSSEFTYILNEDGLTYSVAGLGTVTDTDLIIPSTYAGRTVTGIGENAFYNCTTLTSVELPDTIINISPQAFYGCTSLKSVNIPKYVTTIGGGAFRRSSITSIELPLCLESFGSQSLADCQNLLSITINEDNPNFCCIDNCLISGTTLIAGCQNSIIPDTVDTIGTSAFYGCTQLKNLTIPNSVVRIEMTAFYTCNGLTEINFPESVKYLEYNAFGSCHGLTSVYIPETLTYLDTPFLNCNLLTSFTVSEENPMYKSENNCLLSKDGTILLQGLLNSTIPDSVTTIAQNAYHGDMFITSIKIPITVTTIRAYAFSSCRYLTDIYYDGTKEDWTILGEETYSWAGTTPNYTVHCSDGDLPKLFF